MLKKLKSQFSENVNENVNEIEAYYLKNNKYGDCYLDISFKTF